MAPSCVSNRPSLSRTVALPPQPTRDAEIAESGKEAQPSRQAAPVRTKHKGSCEACSIVITPSDIARVSNWKTPRIERCHCRLEHVVINSRRYRLSRTAVSRKAVDMPGKGVRTPAFIKIVIAGDLMASISKKKSPLPNPRSAVFGICRSYIGMRLQIDLP